VITEVMAASTKPTAGPRLASLGVVVVAFLASAPGALAQTAVKPGRFELSIGAGWIGRVSLGSQDANEVTGSGSAFRLFGSSTELAPSATLEARFGLRLARSIDVEAAGMYGRPDMRIRIQNDFETSNAPLVASSTIHQFMIGGAGLWYPARARLGTRTRLFVRGGANFVRQVQGGRILAVDGATYEVGGGAKVLLATRDAAKVKGIGARVDARAVVWSGAVTLDERIHVAPSIAGSLFLRF
jgi:hypothetical protein